MSLNQFVGNTLGPEKLTLLTNMRRGGDNNSKGGKLEQFYATSSICRIAANEESLDDFIITSQELGFVDDLTIRQESVRKKTNYQIKNSSTSAADWGKKITERFTLQNRIDSEFHGYTDNEQILLVSCPKKASRNRNKIPSSLKGIGFCELFNHRPNSFEQIEACQDLKRNLGELCGSNELLTLDTAFKYVLSVWECNQKTRSVAEIMVEAQAIAKPKVFKTASQDEPPAWLFSKCSSFQGMQVRVESGHFIVSYSGFQATLGQDMVKPDDQALENMSTAKDFIMYLMSTIELELN